MGLHKEGEIIMASPHKRRRKRTNGGFGNMEVPITDFLVGGGPAQPRLETNDWYTDQLPKKDEKGGKGKKKSKQK